MARIDRNDAPEGTKAYVYHGVQQYGCGQCHFDIVGRWCPQRNGQTACRPSARPDQTAVIFMTKEEHKAAQKARAREKQNEEA